MPSGTCTFCKCGLEVIHPPALNTPTTTLCRRLQELSLAGEFGIPLLTDRPWLKNEELPSEMRPGGPEPIVPIEPLEPTGAGGAPEPVLTPLTEGAAADVRIIPRS